MDREDFRFAFIVIFVIILALAGIGGLFYIGPKYGVYKHTLKGKAQLKKAEFTRQIAALDAQAEVERAHGVAEANKIIGESLRDNEEYLRYLWIIGLHDGTSETIYIPTEANLPILEARDK